MRTAVQIAVRVACIALYGVGSTLILTHNWTGLVLYATFLGGTAFGVTCVLVDKEGR